MLATKSAMQSFVAEHRAWRSASFSDPRGPFAIACDPRRQVGRASSHCYVMVEDPPGTTTFVLPFCPAIEIAWMEASKWSTATLLELGEQSGLRPRVVEGDRTPLALQFDDGFFIELKGNRLIFGWRKPVDRISD
ncbi:hypothetical protein B7R22_05610 [Subtercola boreus]|uniref:Uncharacterized protein n=1 Tax=Subtercola boreus TaxID=120213 RepID=A0A3E0W430_9MICO|nr:hypothetical protein B7R22_05610 [Subtercola boreus]